MHVMQPDDCSSLLAPTTHQHRTFPQTRLAGTTAVEIAPLDAFAGPGDLSAPALLKLDVQGFELAALEGCASLLDRFAAIYVECSFVPLYAGQPLADEVPNTCAQDFAWRGSTTGARPRGVPCRRTLRERR